MNGTILPAVSADIPQLLQLINSAYRGEHAKKGWTHEADLIDGAIRTDHASLQQLIENPAAAILKVQQANKIIGCVYLEKKDQHLYLGMLTVSPEIQAQGIGKQLLRAADEYAKQNSCNTIEMTVISVRQELIRWYERNGYHQTSKREPFPSDGKFGNPRQQLEFIYMEKQL